MTSDNHKGLTAYQKAMLTHLGIVPWQLKSNSSDIPEAQSVQTSNGLAQTTSSLEKITPSQGRREAGLEKLKVVVATTKKSEKQRIKMPGQGLILVEDNKEYMGFIIDVMQTIGMDTKQYRIAQPSQQDEFQDFKFLWSISVLPIAETTDILAKLDDQHLTTMKINSDNALALKKQLWRILQNYTVKA